MHQSIGASRVLCVAFGVIAALAGEAFSTTFTNSTPIAIPGPGSSDGSEISVSGLGNSITSVSVSVSNFSDTHVGDVGLVLVGPTGTALALQGDCGGSTSAMGISLAFADGASMLPENLLITSGTFQPTQYASIGSFPSPGPGLAYNSPAPFGTSTFLTTFAGDNPNGNWSLYAMDPISGDTGEISNGWTLQITAVPEPASLSLVALAGASLICHRKRVLRR